MTDDTSLRKNFEDFEKHSSLFKRAKKLIDSYGETSKIPIGELEDIPSGFKDSDLLACCLLIEKDNKKAASIH